MLSQRKMLYSFGDQNIFIFPAKNARGRTERHNHYNRYTHLQALGIIMTSNLQNKQFMYKIKTTI